ncbi:FMN-dependent dehydrogenase-domain-containing protein [Cantharellus anzutake]|uniref:FMN-dependent dehydrogenase-domain-containing protein n=1 Tax=Cantharellus anzutake TaxID=1750568 RepID=UPI001906A286|nr:FMN-dependent dehydrogenase-domain-containing protein [Cantharellus anzutake]KAF8333154.1 FMN-dependent dehydrogenase-domain-containing protein [Cantharellus anzutake]
MLSANEVSIHNSRLSCWIIVSGNVYDVTDFLDEHPGGSATILRYAGRDATAEYQPIHSPTTLRDYLPEEKCLGPVDLVTMPKRSPIRPSSAMGQKIPMPPLENMISLLDFENVAKENLSRKAWAYFSSGATDMATVTLNRAAWNSVLFVPRVMVDVRSVDTSATMAGMSVTVPFFISATGMSKLAHPLGEVGFSRAAGREGVFFCISTNSSASMDEIVQAKEYNEQPFLFQLYMNKDRRKSTALLQKVASYHASPTPSSIFEKKNVRAVIVTVDSPAPGKREADERVKAEVSLDMGVNGGKGAAPDSKGGGIGRAMSGFIDPNVTWSDIAWIRKQLIPTTSSASGDVPFIGVKGIQCVQDALLAIGAGANIIWLSNHGGRALDSAPPALYVLAELRRDHPWVFNLPNVEFYVDGGIRRGTDVVKALCLGAKAAGLGRPFLYALQYGVDGVQRAIQILKDEVETTMRLIGATKVSDLGPHLLNMKALLPYLNDPISEFKRTSKAPKSRHEGLCKL